MIFVDSGAWFASVVPGDANFAAAQTWLLTNQTPFLTTDYIIDETLTLLRARGENRRAIQLGDQFFAGAIATIHSLTNDEITAAWHLFRGFDDKEWSFTDCTCKVVMASFGITTAFSFDRHFHQFGDLTVVPGMP